MKFANEIRRWFIYKITSPTGAVYIGKTLNLDSRVLSYKRQYKKNKSQKILFASLSLHGGYNHTYEVIDEFDSTFGYANGKEMFWIKTYMSNRVLYKDGHGMNMTKGGGVSSGFKWSTNPSDRKPGYWAGLKLPEETVRKMILSRIGKVGHTLGKKIHSEDFKKWVSEKNKGNTYVKGKKYSKEHCANQSRIKSDLFGHPIIQYRIDGHKIAEFPSVRVAAKLSSITREIIIRSLKSLPTKLSNFYYFAYKYVK